MMRWIDGEMDADEKAEFEAEMKRHDDEGDVIGHMALGEMTVDSHRARAEKDAAELIGTALRSEMRAGRDLPDARAFNEGILKRISN